MFCVDCKKEINSAGIGFAHQIKPKTGRKIVLSLDGGGIRCLFQVRILQRIKQDFKVCLCSLFDMVVGTSLGGAIALALAQANKDSIDKLLDNFLDDDIIDRLANKSIFDKVFDKLQFSPVYDGKGKTDVMQGQYTGNFGEVAIPAVITAYNMKECKPYFFCSWKPEDKNHPLWLIADITTSAPIYFPPIKVNGVWWSDGGIAVNNPSAVAYTMCKEYFSTTQMKILSIGAGIYKENWNKHDLDNWGAPQWICHGILDLFLSAPSQATSEIVKELLDSNWIRLDSTNIDEIKLDDTREETIKFIIESADKVFETRKKDIERFLTSTI